MQLCVGACHDWSGESLSCPYLPVYFILKALVWPPAQSSLISCTENPAVIGCFGFWLLWQIWQHQLFSTIQKKGHMHPKCLHTLKNCHMLGFFYIYCTWAWNAFLTCFMPTVFFCVFAFCVFFPGLRDRLFSFFANGIELVLFILKHFPNQPASCSLHSHHPLPPANSYHFHFHAFNAGLKRSASTYLCASITATSSAFSTCYAATIYIMLFGHCEAKMWKIKQSLFQLFTYFCSDKTFVHLVHWQTSWSHLECFFFITV